MDIPDMVIEMVGVTALFLLLELTVILPLIKRIVSQEVDDHIIPSLKDYIGTVLPAFADQLVPKVTESVSTLANKIWYKVRGSRGGASKGVNGFVERVINGEDPDTIQKEYTAQVVEQGLDIVQQIVGRLAPKEEEKPADQTTEEW